MPRIGLGIGPLEPLRKAIRDSRQKIEKAGSDIRSLGDEIHGAVRKEHQTPLKAPESQNKLSLSPTARDFPSNEETTQELKRRLAKELYRAELDLSNKLRIAGKPCDCLDSKHTLGLEATAEELISNEPENAVYFEIIDWIKNNRPKVTIEGISSGLYDKEYPVMAAEFREFRKRIMGTTALGAMIKPEEQISLDDAKKMAAESAEKEVEKRWKEKKSTT